MIPYTLENSKAVLANVHGWMPDRETLLIIEISQTLYWMSNNNRIRSFNIEENI
jgi:hypothetical protein